MELFTTEFWKDAGVRAIKTVAQTAVAMVGVDATIGSIDIWVVISSSLLAGVLSILMSIATPKKEE